MSCQALRVAASCRLALALAALGCDGGSSRDADRPATPAESDEQAASRRFKNLVDEVERRIAFLRSAGPVIAAGPIVELTTTVDKELIPPSSEGVAWRGKVTVLTQSKVTVIDVPEREDEEDPDEGRGSSPEEDAGPNTSDSAGLAPAASRILDEFSSGGDAGAARRTPLLRVFDDEKRETYDFIFEDGRWRLTTPIDPDSEMGLVLGIALKSQ